MPLGTLGEAMQQAGVKRPLSADERLRQYAIDAIGSPGDSLPLFMRALTDDPEATLLLFTIEEIERHATRKLAEFAHEMRGEAGHAATTDGHRTVTRPSHADTPDARGQTMRTDGQRPFTPGTPSQSSRDRAGQGGFTPGQRANTRHRPGHAKQRSPESLRRVAMTVARSVLDSVRVRNGKAIGDCTPVELRELAGQNLREGFLCRLVLKSARLTPANDGQPLRQWCDEATLERCIQQAASHEDLYTEAA